MVMGMKMVVIFVNFFRVEIEIKMLIKVELVKFRVWKCYVDDFF